MYFSILHTIVCKKKRYGTCDYRVKHSCFYIWDDKSTGEYKVPVLDHLYSFIQNSPIKTSFFCLR